MEFIESLKDLEKLLKLCRKTGVSKIKLGSVELELGNSIPSELPNIAAETGQDRFANFPQGELSNKQLAFYSAGGDPSEDPENETMQ